MDFLKLNASDFEQLEEGEGEAVETEQEPEKSFESEHKAEIDKDELIDEIKRLDIGNEEESAYVDINYWKPVIDYDVDDLLGELKK